MLASNQINTHAHTQLRSQTGQKKKKKLERNHGKCEHTSAHIHDNKLLILMYSDVFFLHIIAVFSQCVVYVMKLAFRKQTK